jgi:hypothetical protein
MLQIISKEVTMKNLKTILLASVMVAGVAQADCCVTDCCQVKQCVKKVVKMVPYEACEDVCVPVTDACGRVVGHKMVKQTYIAYKKVVVEKKVDCCCCN